MKSAKELICEVARLWAPPPDLSASEWADRYFHLSSEYSAEHGKWTTLPYQREPLNTISDPRVSRTVIKAGRQMLKSICGMIAVGYYSHQDPCPILVVQPGQEDAESFSRERIAPMIRDNPVLRDLYADPKQRDSGNTLGQKQFPGGGLSIVGAGSPRTVARRTIRLVIFDEVDKYKPTSEGNVIAIGRHCMTTFRHRAKELDVCTPTVAGSNIDRAYEESDQRELYLPCPYCGHKQSLNGKFYKQVRWDTSLLTREEQAATARYHCEACDAPWTDAERMAAVANGEWIAAKPFNGIAGFWISQLYSPWKQLSEIVLDFLNSKDDVENLQTFVNCVLAENWELPGEQLEYQTLVERREDYAVGTVPRGGLFLVASVDVQRADGGRLEARVMAHGENRERWMVDYRILPGDPTDLDSPMSPWLGVEAMLSETWKTESGAELGLERMFVDSGDGAVTPFVYEWVSKQPRPKVWAIKGDKRCDTPVGPPKSVEVTSSGRRLKFGVVFKVVNSDFFKAQILADLKKRPPTEDEREMGIGYPQGYIHIPRDTTFNDEHCKQLCSEALRVKKKRGGRTVTEFEQTRPRNEALDTLAYTDAAAWDYGANRFQAKHWESLRKRIGSEVPGRVVTQTPGAVSPPSATAATPPAPMPRQQPRQRVQGSTWMRGFLR